MKDSTVKRFEKFLRDNPQFLEFLPSKDKLNVHDRKKVLKKSQAAWRNTRKRRKMGYGHGIKIKEGNIFSEAFSPLVSPTKLLVPAKNTISAQDTTFQPPVIAPTGRSVLQQDITSTTERHSGNMPNRMMAQTSNTFKNYFLNHIDADKSDVTPNVKIIPLPIQNFNTVFVRGKRYTVYDCGGAGNCFFHAISFGLEMYRICRTHVELRKMLSDWLKDSDNATWFNHSFGATPNEIIPHLGHLSHHCPSPDGWSVLTKHWNWQDWGEYLSIDGRWAGGLELSPMNLCLNLHGINNNVNLWKRDIELLCENQLNSNTILLMLSNNHFTYLREM